MSLISKVARFARSPQGQRLTRQAVHMARDPKTKRQIQSARTKLLQRGKRA
jgi:hypothetical protein